MLMPVFKGRGQCGMFICTTNFISSYWPPIGDLLLVVLSQCFLTVIGNVELPFSIVLLQWRNCEFTNTAHFCIGR